MENVTNFVAYAQTKKQLQGPISTQMEFDQFVEVLFEDLNNFHKFDRKEQQDEQEQLDEQEQQEEQEQPEEQEQQEEQVRQEQQEEQERDQMEQFLADQARIREEGGYLVDYGQDDRPQNVSQDAGEVAGAGLGQQPGQQEQELEDQILQYRQGRESLNQPTLFSKLRSELLKRKSCLYTQVAFHFTEEVLSLRKLGIKATTRVPPVMAAKYPASVAVRGRAAAPAGQ